MQGKPQSERLKRSGFLLIASGAMFLVAARVGHQRMFYVVAAIMAALGGINVVRGYLDRNK